MMLLLAALFLVSALCQIDRILPFILSEAIKADLSLSDTQIGLINGVAFAVCYSLLSLPLARSADRGSPRIVLVACILVWSAMTSLGGLAAGFAFLAFSRLGVAIGEAGAVPAGHSLIARKIAPQRRGLAIGVFAMGIPMGAMAGFALGGLMNDAFGWRAALLGAGALGVLIALVTWVTAGPTAPLRRAQALGEPFMRSALRLLSSPDYRWLFAAAVAMGFAAAPFYAFATPFLIREHGFSASQAGVAFGLMQGLLGLFGTILGGRGFDRAVRSGSGQVLAPPAILFFVAAVTTTAALIVPVGWMALALFAPAMLSFSFMLPWAFGSGHLVAGRGKEALASSLGMIGSGLLGPALGPLIVGAVSDAASAAQIPNGLGLGLLIVPAAAVLAGAACLIANNRIAANHFGKR
ncbi:MFS transporter [Caulobacter segnis]|uniref:MFS transporter n=1 Tax=Caulobacter segnis TaxID=88688 RepID=UPI0024102839|nr:MFS transporter [Caulobacter segnis]MDG2522577.1 MFS transporter [Caulobacter segnis]